MTKRNEKYQKHRKICSRALGNEEDPGLNSRLAPLLLHLPQLLRIRALDDLVVFPAPNLVGNSYK